VKISYRLFSTLVILIVIVACRTSTNDEPTITTQLSPPASELEDFERSPTVTAKPSSTPLPSKTPEQTKTAIVQNIISIQSTEQALLAQFPRGCDDSFGWSISPNGLWLTETCYSQTDSDLILTISQKDSTTIWKLKRNDYIFTGDGSFWPDGGITTVLWSADGKYVFFTSYYAGDGGECYVPNTDIAAGLFRLDLETGQTISIATSVFFSESGAYLWSEDGLGLVYSTVEY